MDKVITQLIKKKISLGEMQFKIVSTIFLVILLANYFPYICKSLYLVFVDLEKALTNFQSLFVGPFKTWQTNQSAMISKS